MIKEFSPGPSRNSITRYCSPSVVSAVLERLDDARMLDLGERFRLRVGFLSPLKRASNSAVFFAIENLQPHDLAGLAVAGLVELRHRARNGLAQQRKPRAHVDAVRR